MTVPQPQLTQYQLTWQQLAQHTEEQLGNGPQQCADEMQLLKVSSMLRSCPAQLLGWHVCTAAASAAIWGLPCLPYLLRHLLVDQLVRTDKLYCLSLDITVPCLGNTYVAGQTSDNMHT